MLLVLGRLGQQTPKRRSGFPSPNHDQFLKEECCFARCLGDSGLRGVFKAKRRGFQGGNSLGCSENTLAESSDVTISSYKEKHLIPPLVLSLPPPLVVLSNSHSISVSEPDMLQAIISFPNVYAGVPVGLGLSM